MVPALSVNFQGLGLGLWLELGLGLVRVMVKLGDRGETRGNKNVVEFRHVQFSKLQTRMIYRLSVRENLCRPTLRHVSQKLPLCCHGSSSVFLDVTDSYGPVLAQSKCSQTSDGHCSFYASSRRFYLE